MAGVGHRDRGSELGDGERDVESAGAASASRVGEGVGAEFRHDQRGVVGAGMAIQRGVDPVARAAERSGVPRERALVGAHGVLHGDDLLLLCLPDRLADTDHTEPYN